MASVEPQFEDLQRRVDETLSQIDTSAPDVEPAGPSWAAAPVQTEQQEPEQQAVPFASLDDFLGRPSQGQQSQPEPSATVVPFKSLEDFLGYKPEPPKSPYSGALTTLGGTPEAEAVTQPGGAGYVAPQGDDGSLQSYARIAAQRAGIDPDIFTAQIQQESGFREGLTSPAGARGIAQIVPRFHPNVNPDNPREALDYAANLMASHLKRYGGDYAKALAAYNAGPGAVEQYGGVPPFKETQKYVSTILGSGRQNASVAGGAGVNAVAPASRSGAGAFDSASIAEQWKGLPYVFGGKGGRGAGVTATDCSGFVSEVFKQAGLDLPAHTDAAYNALRQRGQAVDPKDAQPGDVVFYMGAGTGGAITHHMGIYAGPGKVLDMSVANGGGVKERPIGHAGEYVIMRDPRMNAPVAPQRAEEAPPIQPTGIAEQLGGQKVKGADLATAMRDNPGTLVMEDLSGRGDDGWSGEGRNSDIGEVGRDDASVIGREGKTGSSAQGTPLSPPVRDIRGDYAPAEQPVGPAVPYGVAGNVEPGDFAIPGRPLEPAGSSGTLAPSGAVEPEGTQAPASSGNPIVDTLTGMGRSISDGFAKLGELLSPTPGGFQQAGQDIRERQATLPGTPQAEALAQQLMPMDKVGAEMERYGIPQLVREYQDAIRRGDTVEALRLQREATNRIAMALPDVRNQILDAVAEPLGLGREGRLGVPIGQVVKDVPGVNQIIPPEARVGLADVVGNLAGGPGSFNASVDTVGAIGGAKEGDLAASLPLAIWGAGQLGPTVVRQVKRAGGSIGDAIEQLSQRLGRPLSEPEVQGITREWGESAGRYLPEPNLEGPAPRAVAQAPSAGIVSNPGEPYSGVHLSTGELEQFKPWGEPSAYDIPSRVFRGVTYLAEDAKSGWNGLRASVRENWGGREPTSQKAFSHRVNVDPSIVVAQDMFSRFDWDNPKMEPEWNRLVAWKDGLKNGQIPQVQRGIEDLFYMATHADARPKSWGFAELPGVQKAMDLMGIDAVRVGDEAGTSLAVRNTSKLSIVGRDAVVNGVPSAGIVSRAQADDAIPQVRGVIQQADDAIPQVDRYYHGTGSDFARPDPGTFNPDGLFGPGYYLTDDARVAGGAIDNEGNLAARGYSQQSDTTEGLRRSLEVVEATKRSLANDALSGDAARKAYAQRTLPIIQAEIDRVQDILASGSGPNIRPVDVPRDLRLLDMDQPLPIEEAARIMSSRGSSLFREDAYRAHLTELQRIHPDGFIHPDEDILNPSPTGLREFFRGIDARNPTGGNKVLSQAGYDGIRYNGGKRIPMMDEAGKAIEHNAVVIFPESLDKIRNATAGTPGGFLPSPARDTRGGSTGALPALGRSLGAGTGAAYQESQQEGATTESVTDAFLRASGTSLARSATGALLRPGRRSAVVARAIPGQPWDSPYADQAPRQSTSRTEGLAPVERVRRMFVRAWTDDIVDLAEVQREAQRAIGRPLTAPEMVTELSRRNPLAAAEVAVKSGPFRDAIQSVGDDVDVLDEVLTYRDMLDVAAATGNPNRRFSGGLRAADAQQRLDWYRDPANVDPARWQRIENAANQLRGWVDEYRMRMRDAGVWSDELHDALRQQYPNYVPTRILDYMRDPDNIAVGKSLSLRDRGLRALTDEGTERAREQPLASLIRYAVEAENTIHKNQVYNAFVNLSNEAPDVVPLRPVPNGYTRARGEEIITGFENGVRTTYVTTAPIAAAIKMEAAKQIPVVNEATRLFRELITRSPVFVAGQVPLDAMSYLVRETAREGGPQAAPRVAAELVRAYADAFRGLTTGRVTGDLYRAIREGGGMAGIHDRTQRAMATKLDDVTRRNMFEVRSADDMRRLLQWVASFEWSQAVGQRVEMAPRLAAARLGEARALRQGANVDTAALRGVMDFRDVTLDFQRGGTWARTMNSAIPFFNVGWQSAATVQRAWRENPRAFPLTALALIGAPTAAAEAWNRADPQRAQDYDDVPDYIKDRGIVIMLPGVEGEDAQGNRRPQYALIPTRELSPFVILAREATAKAMGDDTRGADALLGAAVSAASPIQANNPADFFNTFTPFGVSTGLQLSANRDMFRERDIATERNDEEASNISKALAERLGVRPSQVEFAVRDLGGHAGASVLAAGDLLTGRERPSTGGVQDAPIVGGLAKRFVGNAIGQNLQDARDEMLSPVVKQALRDAGMRDDQVTAVRSDIQGLKLTHAEQAEYQAAFNDAFTTAIERYTSHPRWESASQTAKEQAIRQAATDARERARAIVVRNNRSVMTERAREQREPASVR